FVKRMTPLQRNLRRSARSLRRSRRQGFDFAGGYLPPRGIVHARPRRGTPGRTRNVTGTYRILRGAQRSGRAPTRGRRRGDTATAAELLPHKLIDLAFELLLTVGGRGRGRRVGVREFRIDCILEQRFLQLAACSIESRAYRSDRNAQRFGNFLVRES